jgi:hypothetical protein
VSRTGPALDLIPLDLACGTLYTPRW